MPVCACTKPKAGLEVGMSPLGLHLARNTKVRHLARIPLENIERRTCELVQVEFLKRTTMKLKRRRPAGLGRRPTSKLSNILEWLNPKIPNRSPRRHFVQSGLQRSACGDMISVSKAIRNRNQPVRARNHSRYHMQPHVPASAIDFVRNNITYRGCHGTIRCRRALRPDPSRPQGWTDGLASVLKVPKGAAPNAMYHQGNRSACLACP